MRDGCAALAPQPIVSHRYDGDGDETVGGCSREDNEIQRDLRTSLTVGSQRTSRFPLVPACATKILSPLRDEDAHTMRAG